jgi:hypothetical protein
VAGRGIEGEGHGVVLVGVGCWGLLLFYQHQGYLT